MDDALLLRELVTIADHGNLTEAADELAITQPALSRSMRRLEASLGVELFDRSRKNRLTLTRTGKMAVERARPVLGELDRLFHDVQEYDRSLHSVAFGACSPPVAWGIERRLEQAFPTTSFPPTIDPTAALVEKVAQGELQLAFVDSFADVPGTTCFPWCSEHLFTILPKDHPLATGDAEPSFATFDGQSVLLQTSIGDWGEFVTRLMPHSTRIQQESRKSLEEIALHSDIPGFMSDLSVLFGPVPEGRVAVPMTGPGTRISIFCLCGPKLPDDVRAFMDGLRAELTRPAPEGTSGSGHAGTSVFERVLRPWGGGPAEAERQAG